VRETTKREKSLQTAEGEMESMKRIAKKRGFARKTENVPSVQEEKRLSRSRTSEAEAGSGRESKPIKRGNR